MPQQFVVPQFIDVESKIFGPITMRQFVILLVAALVEFIIFKLSDFTLFLILSVIVIMITVAIAFLKVNGSPMHEFLLSVILNFKRPNVRVWDKSLTDAEVSQFLTRPVEVVEAKLVRKTLVGGSRLAELSLIVDTGGVYHGEEGAGKK